MSERSAVIDGFLNDAGWAGAVRAPLAGDASFRKYERVGLNGRQAVLMDAPPAKEDVRPFIQVAEQLLSYGMSAPKILASDISLGLLLLEDLGDDLFTSLLRKDSAQEENLYLAAADVLVDLYDRAQNDSYESFAPYDETLLMREVGLFCEWFLPAVVDLQHAASLAAEYNALWRSLLEHIPALRPVLVMRDYHADNLIWLPGRKDMTRVGLLDFQDAVIGSPAYDMASFLEDARRDVKAQTVERVLSHYLERTGIPGEDFMTAYALLGAQRNCKIIGIFVRLAVRDGKQHYLSYLPRVWGHLARDLTHPALQPLRAWMDSVIRPEWRGVISTGNTKVQAAG